MPIFISYVDTTISNKNNNFNLFIFEISARGSLMVQSFYRNIRGMILWIHSFSVFHTVMMLRIHGEGVLTKNS